MIHQFEEIKVSTVIELAKKMAIAAKTAPKARGIDNLSIVLVTDDDIKRLSNHMKFIAQRDNIAFFERDALNLEHAFAVLLLGTVYKSLGLKNCGWCGFETCDIKEQHPEHPCVYNVHDLGVAVGSAVALAAQFHVDNRVMFSIGKAAIELKMFNENVKAAFGIPLTAYSKNPFFDRKPI